MQCAPLDTRALLVAVLAAGSLAAAGPAGPAAGAATCHGEPVTILGTSGHDELDGTPGRDVIAGRGGDDVLRGLRGNDVLCGGGGADTLIGGRGDDRLYGDLDRVEDSPDYHRGDALVGGPGDDLLAAGFDRRVRRFEDSGDTVLWTESPRAVRVDLAAGTARGEGRDQVRLRHGEAHLTPYADTFRGTAGHDEVHALGGVDAVRTGDGPDAVWADEDEARSHDTVVTGAGDDDVWSFGGYDEIRLGSGRDSAHVVGDPDGVDVHAGRGNDVIEALVPVLADQVMSAGPADDPGRDVLRIEVAGDPASHSFDMATGILLLGSDSTAVAAPGFEVAELYQGRFDVQGTVDGDRVLVNLGSTFHGLGGDDEFGGSPEDDTFDGGDGTDTYVADLGGTNTCISVEADPNAACD